VKAERTGEEARLSVSDTGAGFDPETTAHLFDRFYRADTPVVQAQSSSGLGLSIVKTVVEVYGGSVEAQSAGPGQGSTFTIRLPLGGQGSSPPSL
ncbi:MAG: sensor histidine kinase, partial [Rhodothermales bacterium]